MQDIGGHSVVGGFGGFLVAKLQRCFVLFLFLCGKVGFEKWSDFFICCC